MKKIFLFLHFLFSQFTISQTVNYLPSDQIIANPERGLQKYSITSNNYATTNGANNLSVATLNSWKNSSDKVTIVYRYFMLDAFMTSNINSIYLSNIQTDFNNIRNSGLKTIVRFAYTNSYSSNAQQPSKNQILNHITQLSSVLNNNKDVILTLQAGFIGT